MASPGNTVSTGPPLPAGRGRVALWRGSRQQRVQDPMMGEQARACGTPAQLVLARHAVWLSGGASTEVTVALGWPSDHPSYSLGHCSAGASKDGCVVLDLLVSLAV